MCLTDDPCCGRGVKIQAADRLATAGNAPFRNDLKAFLGGFLDGAGGGGATPGAPAAGPAAPGAAAPVPPVPPSPMSPADAMTAAAAMASEPSASAASAAPSAPSARALGARVRIIGLEANPEHNGKLGTVKREAVDDRVGVRLDNEDKFLALRLANLELVDAAGAPPPPGETTSSS